MVAKMSKQTLQWQAEDDAHVMARYQEIVSNKGRMNRAMKEAKRQAQDLTRRANALKDAANNRAFGGKVNRRKK